MLGLGWKLEIRLPQVIDPEAIFARMWLHVIFPKVYNFHGALFKRLTISEIRNSENDTTL